MGGYAKNPHYLIWWYIVLAVTLIILNLPIPNQNNVLYLDGGTTGEVNFKASNNLVAQREIVHIYISAVGPVELFVEAFDENGVEVFTSHVIETRPSLIIDINSKEYLKYPDTLTIIITNQLLKGTEVNVDFEVSNISSLPIATSLSAIILLSYFGLMRLKDDWGKILGDDIKFRDWIYLMELGIHSFAMLFTFHHIYSYPQGRNEITEPMIHIYATCLLTIILFWIGFWTYSLVEDQHPGIGQKVTYYYCERIALGFFISYLVFGFMFYEGFGMIPGLFFAVLISGLLFINSIMDIVHQKFLTKI